jgi:hypothetical protein
VKFVDSTKWFGESRQIKRFDVEAVSSRFGGCLMAKTPIIRRESKAKEKLLQKKAWESVSFGAEDGSGQARQPFGYWIVQFAKSQGLKTGASELIEDCIVHAYNSGRMAEIIGKKTADDLAKTAYPEAFLAKKKTRKPKKGENPALEGAV